MFLTKIFKIIVLILFIVPVFAEEEDDVIEKWIDYFQPSVLSREEIRQELLWFREASREFKGETLFSCAEDISTHFWERDVLSEAFEEITGIKVEHEIVGEGDLVKKISEQMMTGRLIKDIYVNDADFIGTHMRLGRVLNLGDYMIGEGKKYTNPSLDLDDFLNLEPVKDYGGNLYQLPDQQFVNLYWFRYDWFTDEKTKKDFYDKYGYELGVPLNWAAYEDIAEFFTGREMTNPNGSRVKAYGHLDYGKPSPSLGWRFTDAWLSIAGVGDKGLPNGLPVDEWGIRVENRIPVGSTVSRGGALDGPAAIYALQKYLDWLNKYSPPESKNWEWSEAGPMAKRGDIAQRIFQYTTWLSDEQFHKLGSPVVGKDGKPVWRVAPTPVGKYWDEGMKVGYQDAGSFTIPWNVREERRHMAWLWAQFCVSKTVSVKKFLVGGTPVRKSTVNHPFIVDNSYNWGGIIEFYRSKESKKWTDTGLNVPHYPALSSIWSDMIGKAVRGELTAEETMKQLAEKQDEILSVIKLKKYSPSLNAKRDPKYWLEKEGAPKKERGDQKARTVSYDELIKSWEE